MRRWLDWTPDPLAVQAAFIAQYVETFHPAPSGVTWREMEILQCWQAARAAWENEKYGNHARNNRP